VDQRVRRPRRRRSISAPSFRNARRIQTIQLRLRPTSRLIDASTTGPTPSGVTTAVRTTTLLTQTSKDSECRTFTNASGCRIASSISTYHFGGHASSYRASCGSSRSLPVVCRWPSRRKHSHRSTGALSEIARNVTPMAGRHPGHRRPRIRRQSVIAGTC